MGDGSTPVTVVIPVFDGERFLAEAIESVLAQDHPDVEVVVVDDGSTDSTPAVAQAFKGIRYLRQDNQGPAAARVRGAEVATGEYVAFLDADDQMLPHRLSAQARVLDADPTLGAVLVRHEVLLEDGTELPAWAAPDPVYGDPGGVSPESAMVRASVLEDVGGFDPGYLFGEGFELLTRLRRRGVRVEVLPEIGNVRRIHEKNLTHRNDDMRAGILRSLKQRIDEARAEPR